VLRCAALCCAVLRCAVLRCAVLCCAVLRRTIRQVQVQVTASGWVSIVDETTSSPGNKIRTGDFLNADRGMFPRDSPDNFRVRWDSGNKVSLYRAD
jgi:hypothetical protein